MDSNRLMLSLPVILSSLLTQEAFKYTSLPISQTSYFWNFILFYLFFGPNDEKIKVIGLLELMVRERETPLDTDLQITTTKNRRQVLQSVEMND